MAMRRTGKVSTQADTAVTTSKTPYQLSGTAALTDPPRPRPCGPRRGRGSRPGQGRIGREGLAQLAHLVPDGGDGRVVGPAPERPPDQGTDGPHLGGPHAGGGLGGRAQ